LLSLIATGALSHAFACASKAPQPDPHLAEVWRNYRALPNERALAIAGDLRRDVWVAGSSGGHATRAGAEEAALRECRGRRQRDRAQAQCQLYAVGDEIVWPGP
jgi:hypothetical protein